jgi:multicomponent Na+:H+ antiporter subunit D
MVDLHPGLLLILGGGLVALLPQRIIAPATLILTTLALVVTWRLDLSAQWVHQFYGIELSLLSPTALARPFAVVFAILGVLAAIYGWSLMNRVERAAGLTTLGAGLGVVLAGDLLTMFVFWEFKVITVVILIAARGRASSTAAAQRYLQVHLIGGLTLLGGLMWHTSRTGSFALEGIQTNGPGWLILLGVLVGAAALPLHAWLADAYPSATLTGTVILSAVTTKSAVYVLARTMPGVDLLIWVGVSMAVVGVTLALLQDDLRRLLSYHIISQVGFMVTAIGVGTTAAINGATAHATAHVLYKGLLLMGVGTVIYATGHNRASALGGLANKLPWVLALYMVGAFSISGMLGFSGFPAKELAVASVGAGGETVAQWLLKFASVGTFLSVGLKLPALAWLGTATSPNITHRQIPLTMYLAMGIAAAANIAIGIRPHILYDLLPAAESFQPFTAVKIAESFALLGATALAFLWWRGRLTAKATTTVDVDLVQRELPRAYRTWAAQQQFPGLSKFQPATQIFTQAQAALTARAATRSVAPGWIIGGSVAGAMVLILTTALLGIGAVNRW